MATMTGEPNSTFKDWWEWRKATLHNEVMWQIAMDTGASAVEGEVVVPQTSAIRNYSDSDLKKIKIARKVLGEIYNE